MYKQGTSTLKRSIVDPHHVDPDPDPSFENEAQTLEEVLK